MSTEELSLLYLALAMSFIGTGSVYANIKTPAPILSLFNTMIGAYFLGTSIGYMLEHWNVL